MRTFLGLFFLIAFGLPAHAVPFGQASGSITTHFSSSPGQEIDVGDFGQGMVLQNGQAGATSASLNLLPDFLSFAALSLSPTPVTTFSNTLVDASVTGTDVGGAFSAGAYTWSASLGNFGNQVEAVTFSVDYTLLTDIDLDGFPGLIGASAQIEVALDGSSLFQDQLFSSNTVETLSTVNSFSTTFLVGATNDFSRTLTVEVSAGAQLQIDGQPAPVVPLPASHMLLAVGLGGLAALRRRLGARSLS